MFVPQVTSNQAAWITGTARPGQRDIPTAAYHNAVKLLKDELGINPNTSIPEERAASIVELHATVEKAKQSYDDASKKHTGAKKWLEKFSSRLMYYGNVLDALAQHHPEYVALAWGTIKFVLMGVLNRATLVEELARAFVGIADKLPRAPLNVDLYKTADMEAALARLYASILMFFRLCAKWYNRDSVDRFFSAIKDPFEQKYKALLDDVELCSNLVDNLANAGARVEIRSLHALTEGDHAKLIEIDAKVSDAFNAQMRKLENIEKKILRVYDGQVVLIDVQAKLLSGQTKLGKIDDQIVELVTSQSMLFDAQMEMDSRLTQIYQVVKSSQSTLNATHRAVFRLEFHNVLDFFAPKIRPDAALRTIQPLARRDPTVSNVRLESLLRDWAKNERSSVVILQAGARAQTQATELAAMDVFKSIIFQALQQAGATFADMGEHLDPRKIHGTHTDREWVDLICLLFARLPKAFLIIETEDMRSNYRGDQQWADQFFALIRHIVDKAAAADLKA
ncbi:hypothetical protein E8E13_002571 [Curvularia kusanoi]|uniref:DUF7708 domain-containing protein n=1 Tax=Curvularia kusanoi TaxID=90978 RepID=A0A9P4T743_CURKU|nr:hypothetical protein E8E13_002571 [Curvularia kusanoi]